MSGRKKVQEHYDRVSHLYDKRDVTYPHVRTELFKNLPLERNDIVCDVGCGTGKFLLDLVQNVGSVVGVDISLLMLRESYLRIKKYTNIDLICCDAIFLPLRRAIFDITTSIEVIEHIEIPKKHLNEIEKILKPHGKVFLTTPNELWSPVHLIAERIGMKVTEGPTKHLWPRELRRLIDTSNLGINHCKGTIFYPKKAWKVMEKLSEALNRLHLQDLCLKQIAICTKQTTKPFTTLHDEENEIRKLSCPVSIIIPAYNEAKTLDECVFKVRNFLQQFCDDYEIIIIEDGCTDGTDAVAEKIAEENDDVIHLHYDEKLGRGGALKIAFKIARCEILGYMDVDLATDLSVLPSLIKAAQDGRGMATASRHLQESKVERKFQVRKITSFFYNWLVRVLFHDGIHDHQCGCKFFHRDLILDLLEEVESDEWFWDTEIIVRAKMRGYPVVETPCIWSDPGNRNSKVKIFNDAWDMGWSALKLCWKLRARENWRSRNCRFS